jgi:hypothetical protein
MLTPKLLMTNSPANTTLVTTDGWYLEKSYSWVRVAKISDSLLNSEYKIVASRITSKVLADGV